MSSFLYIQAVAGHGLGTRRVDPGNIAALFSEIEEPVERRSSRLAALRVAASIVLAMLERFL